MSTQDASTWHYGLVARWWADLHQPDRRATFYKRFVEAAEPALDVACGTRRLLLPYLRGRGSTSTGATSRRTCSRTAGGRRGEGRTRTCTRRRCTSSTCRAATGRCSSAAASAWGQPEEDAEAFRRLHAHLAPGGLLVFDNEVPYARQRSVAVLARGQAGRPRAAAAGAVKRPVAPAATAPSMR